MVTLSARSLCFFESILGQRAEGGGVGGVAVVFFFCCFRRLIHV